MVVIEEIWKEVPNPRTTEGFYVPGEIFHVAAFNMRTILDLTTPIGGGSGIIIGFLFRLGKMGFQVTKVEDWMEISPVNAEYYRLTIQQKQQLESQIKTGLAGISTAVSDFELLFHDLRKYKEFMNIFEKIEKGKAEKDERAIMEGEQSLKAIFIDQVDVHTGEGIALKLIAPRWPTIIADFMKLTDEDVDPKEIAKKYKVSEAEGVVLATKNKLYKEWKLMFFRTVIERYARIKGLVTARKRSIDEYRNMLRPYIVRYRSIKELGETKRGRDVIEKFSFVRRGAHAVSMDISTIWAWKAFRPPELAKPSVIAEMEEAPKGVADVLKMKFPPEFKKMVKAELDKIKEARLNKVRIPPSGIEPLDRWVLAFIPYIEAHYKVKLTAVDILQAREKFLGECIKRAWNSEYFMCLEMQVTRMVIRLPDGREMEDLWFEPFRCYLDTQNMILLRVLELHAKEKELESYITEMLGETEEGRKIVELIEEEYPKMFEGVEKEKVEEAKGRKILEEVFRIKKPEEKENLLQKVIRRSEFIIRFIKPGPYETTFDDRVSGLYFREIRDALFAPMHNFLRGSVGVPGFRAV